MANYVLNNFVRQLSNGNIQIFDRYDINQINVNVISITQNYVVNNYIRLESSDNSVHIIDFSDNNEANMALSKLQVEIDIAKSISGGGGGGITNINAQLPLVYDNSILSINQATATQSGFLSYTDYNTFDNKQPALIGTGFVISNGGTISYDTNSYLTTISASSTYLTIASASIGGFGGVQQYDSNIYFPIPGNPSILYVDKSVNLSWYWDAQAYTYSTIIDVFPNDIRVSLPNGKSFGKYASGATISSKGKTSVQVITEAIVEPIPPTVNISTSSSPLIFNQPNPIIVTINFGYTINSLGAVTNTAILQYYSNSNSTWNTIHSIASTSSTSYSRTGFTYAIPNADNPQFNTTPFQFKYVVTDTLYAFNSATSSVTINSYASPTITLTGSASNINLSIESNSNREVGNTSTILKGSVSRNSIYVPISYYQYFVKINNGSYVNIGPTYSISSSGGTFTSSTDSSATSTATTVTYKVTVVDAYTASTATYVVNYNYVLFYGPISIGSTNSSGVRSSSNYQFINGSNPFILNTGTISNVFEVAFSSPHLPTLITDLDALNAPLLNVSGGYFLTNFNVNDGGGTPTLYNIYNMVTAIPYPSNHRHQINYN